MEQLKMVGAVIRFMDYRSHDKGATTFARLDMSADFTETLADKLGCLDMLEIESAKGLVPLTVPDIYLTEASLQVQGMETISLDVVAHKLSDFKVRKLEEESVSRREIQFHLWIPGAEGKAAIDLYEALKATPGVLLVTKSVSQATGAGERVIAEQTTIDGGVTEITDGKPRRKRGRPPTAAKVEASVEA